MAYNLSQEFFDHINNIKKYTAIISRCHRINFSLNKINSTKNAFKLNSEKDNYIGCQEFICFYETFIVSYASLFATADENENIRLNKDDVFKDEKDLEKIHIDIIKQRNQTVAHHDFKGRNGNNKKNTKTYINNIINVEIDEDHIRIITQFAFNGVFSNLDERISNYANLYNFVCSFVRKERKLEMEKIEKLTGKTVSLNDEERG